jgi:hypothetical protein
MAMKLPLPVVMAMRLPLRLVIGAAVMAVDYELPTYAARGCDRTRYASGGARYLMKGKIQPSHTEG